MIKKITLKQVASYENETSLETDKKVNLIYGLNGTGKTVLANYLYYYNTANDNANNNVNDFSGCRISGLNNEELLVYNQQFILDYFYRPDNLKEIFTLSKENKEAAEKVKNASDEIEKLEKQKTDKNTEIEKVENTLKDKMSKAEEAIWNIKTTYAGGDRVLEYCLKGSMGSKNTLLNKILQIPKPAHQSTDTTEQLKKDVEKISGNSAQKYTELPKINFQKQNIESNSLFQEQIVGNDNSSVSKLIKKLNNTDWVKSGLNFLQNNSEKCPFCQQGITPTIIKNIKDFFDGEYEDAIKKLKDLCVEYHDSTVAIPQKNIYENNPFITEQKNEFENLYNSLIILLSNNETAIREKISSPSKPVKLRNSSEDIKKLNEFLSNVNIKITEHNKRIDNKDTALEDIRYRFWNIMRWEYDQPISAYLQERITNKKSKQTIEKDIDKIEQSIKTQKEIISTALKNTVNIEESINNINEELKGLGIDNFSIAKHDNNGLYQIKRTKKCDFQTLSEGEKMIISFLYFCELCKGKKTALSQPTGRKIVVIDDPISSLSHIWVFNVGQLIKEKFFNSDNYEQVFVLTHSLYFFYELTKKGEEKKELKRKLFRIIKNSEGTKIVTMEYEEIQNDYHSYWSIIKDAKQSPALIANCMRNIIEYFFNFVEKKDFKKVFQKAEFKETNTYQAFSRYMNRESHSSGQNIFDIKEFDYDTFKKALELVFEKSGYSEHYKAMTK